MAKPFERVVLWRLIGARPGQAIMCAVQESATGLELRIEQDAEVQLSELYRDRLRLIERSRELRQDFVGKGWAEAEIADED